MIPNKTIFFLTLIAILLIIAIPTINTVNQIHVERLLKVESLKIKERALNCFMENECKEENITLKELIEKNYITRGIDPRTDEYFKDDVYVIIENQEAALFIDGLLIN